MDMGSIEPYRINNEYNISEILAHFDSNYIFHTLEDKLEHIDYTSSLVVLIFWLSPGYSSSINLKLLSKAPTKLGSMIDDV